MLSLYCSVPPLSLSVLLPCFHLPYENGHDSKIIHAFHLLFITHPLGYEIHQEREPLCVHIVPHAWLIVDAKQIFLSE